LELGPLGWRGLWAGHRSVEIAGPTGDLVGPGIQTHAPPGRLDERKMANVLAVGIFTRIVHDYSPRLARMVEKIQIPVRD
jgi:hypothetical protein